MAETHVTREVSEPTSSVSPLLSEEGKDFLAGRIDAKEFVENARRDASVQARREFDIRLVSRKYRHISIRILLFAAPIYAILGIAYLILGHIADGISGLLTSLVMGLVSGLFLLQDKLGSAELVRLTRHTVSLVQMIHKSHD